MTSSQSSVEHPPRTLPWDGQGASIVYLLLSYGLLRWRASHETVVAEHQIERAGGSDDHVTDDVWGKSPLHHGSVRATFGEKT